MKKYLIIFVLLIIPLRVYAISASSAIAMDLDNGRILYGYNIDEKKLIASTTKIMTAIIAIEKGNLDDEIIVTDTIYKSFGSSIYIEVGETLSLKDLLYGLMLRSGNDAALMIAEYISGSKEEFVYLMNEYASNLNLNNTFFYNPHGLEENDGFGNISTARDMANLTKYAMNNEIFRDIFKTKDYKVKTNYKTYLWHNKNKLLNYDYINGGKTGYTEKARRTLVTTGSKNNINIVVVTLNDPNDWQDHLDIYKKIYSEYGSYQILKKDEFIIDNDYYYKKDRLYIKNDYYLTLRKKELDKVVINYDLIKLKDYISDTLVGYASIVIEDNVVHKEPIYVEVKEENSDLNWFQKFKGWLHQW